MEHLAAYPTLSQLTCAECQKHVYTIPDGEPQTYEVDGENLPIVRQVPPPCDDCPRKGPENERFYRLTERNYEAWQMYDRIQATRGAYKVPEHLSSCPVWADNMAIIKRALQAGQALAKSNMYRRSKNAQS